MEKVSKIGAEELESSLAEGDKHGVGVAMRAIWKSDQQNIKKEFDQDQEKNCEFLQGIDRGSCLKLMIPRAYRPAGGGEGMQPPYSLYRR